MLKILIEKSLKKENKIILYFTDIPANKPFLANILLKFSLFQVNLLTSDFTDMVDGHPWHVEGLPQIGKVKIYQGGGEPLYRKS